MDIVRPGRIIRFLFDGGRDQQINCTDDLGRVFILAARAGQLSSDSFDLSFSSLLLGIMAAGDRWSTWFRTRATDERFLEKLLADKKLDLDSFKHLMTMPTGEQELARAFRATSSVQGLLADAIKLRDSQPVETELPLDVVHILSACTLIPPGSLHFRELAEWGLDRERFAEAFRAELAGGGEANAPLARAEVTAASLNVRSAPESTARIVSTLKQGDQVDLFAEMNGWRRIHPTEEQWVSERFLKIGDGERTQTAGKAVGTPLKGLSPHITTDQWTIDDALGYRFYAEAIVGFITDSRTIPPLTISIQAPWGGGKTSLMRMIQQRLDPQAPVFRAAGSGASSDGMTFRKALKELSGDPESGRMLPTVDDRERKRFTVWFNAWKYENTNQVWAGLADTIVRHYAERLAPADRELFWLRLNARRIDPDKVRRMMYEKIFYSLVRRLPLLAASLATAALAAFELFPDWATSSVVGSMVAVLTAFIAWGKKEADEEPAGVTLKDFLDAPDYSSEAGFIHRVADDVQRIFAAIGAEKSNPIVVFIDDLDRCSPGNIAQVTEAINLFLAGEFPHAVFVIGMDSEMVAAALQAAHRELIEHLPPEAGIPVGWRFMDKFVQLPFHIPPAEQDEMSRYAATFFRTDGELLPEAVIRSVNEAAGRIATRDEARQEVGQLRETHNLDERQATIVSRQLEDRVLLERLNAGITTFSDDNPDIVRLVDRAAVDFRGNPRELKRFINLFRFQYNLWCVRMSQELPAPSLEQLSRWTILSIRWPEVVRWLRRSGRHEWQERKGAQAATPTFYARLALLEAISAQDDIASWHKLAKEKLLLEPEKIPWMNDDDLLLFFYTEHQLPAGERLSAGAGLGLW